MGRRRPVGTISMAVLLIITGVVIIIAHINNQPVLDIIMIGWPLILFLLGAEILWYCYTGKEENEKIRYDVFSIFIICIIVIFNFGVYGVAQLGIVSKVDRFISAKEYTMQSPVEEIPLTLNIKKILIDAPYYNLTINTNNNNKIIHYSTSNITALNKEEAKELMQENNINTHISGDTLYISFNMVRSAREAAYYARVSEYTLSIPGDRKVEVNNSQRVDINIDKLNNNWLIDGHGYTNIRLEKDADIQIMAVVDDSREVNGNIQWSPIDTPEELEQESERKKEFTYGTGKNKISIINNNEVTVNRIN